MNMDRFDGISATTLIVCGVVFASGCSSRPARIEPANVDTDQLAATLIERYDTDGSASLNRAEVKSIAAISSVFTEYDDGNDELTAKEISEGLAKNVFDPHTVFIEYSCIVHLKGRPLADAKVEFRPLDSLANAIPPAEAKTDSRGLARLVVAPDQLPRNAPILTGFMCPGLYHVSVTHSGMRVQAEAFTIVEVSPRVLQNGSPILNIR